MTFLKTNQKILIIKNSILILFFFFLINQMPLQVFQLGLKNSSRNVCIFFIFHIKYLERIISWLNYLKQKCLYIFHIKYLERIISWLIILPQIKIFNIVSSVDNGNVLSILTKLYKVNPTINIIKLNILLNRFFLNLTNEGKRTCLLLFYFVR